MKKVLPSILTRCFIVLVVMLGFIPQGVAGSGTAGTAWPPPGFSEFGADQNPTFPDTVATDVAVNAPLPASFGAHPATCDVLHFLRIRHKNGPLNPSAADRILIAQPGILEGASAFYNVGCNVVSRAFREKRKYVEFWAIDRRANALEDLNGLRLARASGNPYDFIDYYYRDVAYNGQHFQGFLDPYTDAAWLIGMGMAQTVIDWNEIITRGIPDQKVRQQKVYLGGHSLGGFITGAYACWDFDGNPATIDDAGYNQCAGYFGLDTLVTSGTLLDTTSTLPPKIADFVANIPENYTEKMMAGEAPRFVYINGVINPEVMNLLTGLGMGAATLPKEESRSIERLPANENITLSYRFYHSRNLAAFLAATPSITKFRYTNQALFAIFIDDNSMPISIVRSSIGFFKGGPVADKEFPVPSNVAEALSEIPALKALSAFLGGGNVAIPTDDGGLIRRGPLYGWYNYNELGGVDIPKTKDGVPYTDSSKEVTDINDLARAMAALPMDFVEKYFPMRLAVDSMFGTDGIVHPEGVSKHPVLDIVAGDGPNLGGDLTPPGSPVIPGYDHLDVLTAAPVQNNRKPEQVTTHLLNFIFQ
ncbi:MAG: hypothetical protein M0036_12520 [Desulfobacteraceae bacterium]|nr:hypothetical protein [Desulfobacteraceae bacterium]